MKNLDLVVSSDTACAHLAGALDVPLWVALGFSPDWRWLTDRADSPWYPRARLFRQPSFDDWSEVFRSIARELQQQVTAHTS
jgi:ADP-heptose:LPS heptosyltransferase